MKFASIATSTCKSCHHFSTWKQYGRITKDKEVLVDNKTIWSCGLMEKEVTMDNVDICKLYNRIDI